jgi:hypothetical protein
LIYNTLNESYIRATDHYQHEFLSLVEGKDKYQATLNGLIEAINVYLIKNDKKQLAGNDRAIYEEINGLMGAIKVALNLAHGRNEWLRDSKALFIDKLIKILDPRGEVSNRELLLHTYRVRDAYQQYIGHMHNVVAAADTNRHFMNNMTNRIRIVGKSLHIYV